MAARGIIEESLSQAEGPAAIDPGQPFLFLPGGGRKGEQNQHHDEKRVFFRNVHFFSRRDPT
jgi:hypothetical protein